MQFGLFDDDQFSRFGQHTLNQDWQNLRRAKAYIYQIDLRDFLRFINDDLRHQAQIASIIFRRLHCRAQF